MRPEGSLLTPNEREIVELLAQAWNKWVDLNPLHPDANAEFLQAIHRAQCIVMARPVQRELNAES